MDGQVCVSQSASGDTIHIHIPRSVAADILNGLQGGHPRTGARRLMEDLAAVLASLPSENRPTPDLTPISRSNP